MLDSQYISFKIVPKAKKVKAIAIESRQTMSIKSFGWWHCLCGDEIKQLKVYFFGGCFLVKNGVKK